MIQNLWLSVGAVFVSFVGLFALGLLFVRASRIERNWLVAICTLVTTAISGAILFSIRNQRDLSDWWVILASLFSLTGFFIGRVVDMMLGPRPEVKRRHATLGADLAD